MPKKQSIDATNHLKDINTRLDEVEQQLDHLEDLLEQLWDSATEPVRTAEN